MRQDAEDSSEEAEQELIEHRQIRMAVLAAEMVGWRKDCKSTIRNSYQILNRGTPNLENELWNVSAQVINGTLTPDAASKQVQGDLDKWYKPAK